LTDILYLICTEKAACDMNAHLLIQMTQMLHS